MTQSGGSRSMRIPLYTFARAIAVTAVLAAVVAIAGCYGFSGGGGFPPKLRSVAIQPFDNQTADPDVQLELNTYMRKAFRDRLNLRDASEAKADVVVRGTIDKYEVDLPAGISADPRQANLSRRRLQLVIDVEIVDQTTGRSLLKRAGLQSEGQYAEGHEADGRKLAIETMVNDMIQGLQSQW
jgi:hypothetical protein